MVDNTDPWWDATPPIWFETPPKNETEYRILRASKTPCTGSPGFIVQWKIYSTYSTSRTRDTALTKLNKDHPKWRLKASSGNPYLEKLGFGGQALPLEGINK
jgi:hypothetical protein